ncbi:MAG: type II/IV secretion system protein [Sulfurimonas sp.]
MKKSFTLLELVFVVVVIGVLSAIIIPSTRSDNLREAAIQVVSHIRYTQHLAMIDDKLDTSDSNWYKKRWTIRFKQDLVFAGSYIPNGTYPNEWAYTVYNDVSKDGNPNPGEMAKNPLNQRQYLSGGYNNTLHIKDSQSMKELRLGSTYGVESVVFSDGCRSNVLYLYFDNLGRPFNSMNTSNPYETASAGWHKLLTSDCKITLNSNEGSVSIIVEPETGYTYISG